MEVVLLGSPSSHILLVDLLLLWICSIGFWLGSRGLNRLLMSSDHFSHFSSILTTWQGGRDSLPVFWLKEWKWGFSHFSRQESVSVSFTLHMPSPAIHCSKCHVYTVQQEIRAPSISLLLCNKSSGFPSTLSSSWGDAGP